MGIEHLALGIVPFFGVTPQVFAHRGGCDLGPENTIAAFDIGMSTGADGLELDVHLSADGIVVVHHDKTLDRTTNASGPIGARTAQELERVDAGYWFRRGDGYPFRGQGIGVPTLGAVLARYRGIPTIIEIKVYTAEMGQAVAEEIRRADALEYVCVAGYGLASARAARAALPGVAASAAQPEVRLAGVPIDTSLSCAPRCISDLSGSRVGRSHAHRYAPLHPACARRQPQGPGLDR
jgi:glycerophosphoryl diester phosphodiesterase